MLEDLRSADEIAKAADRLLRSASAYGRFPTPVNDLVEVADLTEPPQSLLSSELIQSAPQHIRKALAFIGVKVRALLDRKTREIHLQPLIEHSGRRAFKKLHEVGHDILPWQRELVYVDGDATLSWSTKQWFEREANQAAAELFFQRQLFARVGADYSIGIATIIELAQKFGTSIHAAFRRYVETHSSAVAGLVFEQSPTTLIPLTFRRHEALSSPLFTDRYGDTRNWPTILENPPFDFLPAVRTLQGDILPVPFTLPLRSTGSTTLPAELFSNSHTVFALIWAPTEEKRKRRRILLG